MDEGALVMKVGVIVPMPGDADVVLRRLVLDFTGTLSKDGDLLPGVAERLVRLDGVLDIHVLSADTFGKAEAALAGLPVRFERVRTGEDKAAFIHRAGPAQTAAIGNGRNDVRMCGVAALSIAVCGPEGAACELVRVAHVLTRDILDALDLLASPLRLTATLRA